MGNDLFITRSLHLKRLGDFSAVSGVESPLFHSVTETTVAVSATQPQAATFARSEVPVEAPRLIPETLFIKRFNPNFGTLLSQFRHDFEYGGVPRSQISVPIAPATDVTDTMIFENPADPAQKFFLPRYRLGEEDIVGGGRQFKMKLEQAGTGWELTLHLEKFAATEIETEARTALELPHTVAILLQHRLSVNGDWAGQQEIAFQEVTQEPNGLRAVYRTISLAEGSRLYQALTETPFETALIVRRLVKVASPVTNPPPVRVLPILPIRPELSDISMSPHSFVQPALAVRPEVAIRPESTFSALSLQLGRTRFVRHASFHRMADDAVVNGVFTGPALSDAVFDAIRTGPLLNPPPPALYREIERALDNRVAPTPFVFPPALHPSLFPTPPAGGQNFDLVRHQVEWDNGQQRLFYSYYQDRTVPYQFYYLPDTFKAIRRPEPPYLPMLSVRIAGDDPDTLQVSLDIVARPYTHAARLEAAASALAAHIGEPLPPETPGPVFQPLPIAPGKCVLRLTLPQANGATLRLERKDARVDLQLGIVDSVTLPMTLFQTLYAALFSSASSLLEGDVTVTLGAGVEELIPFRIRASDLLGSVFTYEDTADMATGGIQATFTNATESPVEISELTATLKRSEMRFPADIQTLSLPKTLKPGEQVSFLVVPRDPVPPGEPLSAAYDLEHVRSLPEPTAFWNAILDPTLAPEYAREITVRALASTFQPNPDHPADPIRVLVVDFENGADVALSEAETRVSAVIRLPLSNYVLNAPDKEDYRYRVIVVRDSGQTQGEWQTASADILFPILP